MDKSTSNDKIVVAITPTKDRHTFLERQMDSFWKPYEALSDADASVPKMKWIIIDETSCPSRHFSNLNNPNIIYIHIPNRDNLSTIPETFRGVCGECLFSESALKKRVEHLASNTLSDRFIIAHDPWLPSIGEMRNIGLKIAHNLYADKDPNAVVFTKDDDDFSAAVAIPTIYDHLQHCDFVKFGNMLVHDAVSGAWYHYSHSKQDDPTHILENGVEKILPRYVVWDNRAETVENLYKHAGIYGLSFTYRLDHANSLGQAKKEETGVFSPFEPLSRREDVAFFMDTVKHCGEDRVKILDNPDDWIVRIVHNNTTRTMHHGSADLENISSSTVKHVAVLCGKPVDHSTHNVGYHSKGAQPFLDFVRT